jgi:hypothetical protein
MLDFQAAHNFLFQQMVVAAVTARQEMLVGRAHHQKNPGPLLFPQG